MRNPFRWLSALGLVTALGLVACADEGAASGQSTSATPAVAEGKGTVRHAPSPGGAAAAEAQAEPLRIARGERVELVDHLAPGQITIFDFMSDFCGPCVQLAPFLDRLHRERDDITVVKVDINRPGVRGIDWRSPVAMQYRMSSIPHFKIYGADGTMMAEGREATMFIDRWLRELIQSGR